VTLSSQLDYWNRVGPTKTFAHPINITELSRWVEPSARILDYGCGQGRASGVLLSNGFTNLLGLDPAPAMIDAARAHHPAVSFDVLQDFRNTGLPGSSVDAVLLLAVLTSVPRNEDQLAIVNEITRVLRPGGILYISDMWLQTDDRNVERYERDRDKYGIYGVFDLSDGATVRHHDHQWIESLLKDYQPVALEEINIQTMNGNPATAFQWFGRRLERIS
jgi:SAM-dependent methyltransferase